NIMTNGDTVGLYEKPPTKKQAVYNSERNKFSGSKSISKTSKTKNARTRMGGYAAPEPQYRQFKARKIESFPFDPNLVTQEELVRLGLSPRQADVIINYREKGGKFRQKSDFAKMYVVSDTLFERLKPFIEIPTIELNSADSTTLVSLPGIGPYYARKIIEYRTRLGGFVRSEQLMEINGIDPEKFNGFSESVSVDTTKIRHFDIWDTSTDSLSKHPYIGSFAAKGIARYKKVCDTALWTIYALIENNLITPENGIKLSLYSKTAR
ncbi:MAG: helix-hairpin-helix domain-containing protein, partial [Bacteroidales bacterium]|nr:helix-hairpin-helix domain-containing protein [Bacteroidales bacterium]